MAKQFEDVSSRFGAPMGRPEIRNDFSGKARCFRVIMIDGDYDDGGAYWGGNSPLYCATNGEGFRIFCRELSRKAAKIEFQKRANGWGKTITWIN